MQKVSIDVIIEWLASRPMEVYNDREQLLLAFQDFLHDRAAREERCFDVP